MRLALVKLNVLSTERDAKAKAEACEANGWLMPDQSDLYSACIEELIGLVEGTIDAQRYLETDF